MSLLSGAAVAFAVAGLFSGNALEGGAFREAALLGSGGGAVAAAIAAAWQTARNHRAGADPEATLATAMPEWRAGRRAALEAMVAGFVGPEATAHALRCAALADLLAEQLALRPEEAADVSLAAAVHVLPLAFPEHEDGAATNCAFGAGAMEIAAALLERTAPPAVTRIATEVRERWDGTGLPHRLNGEDSSMGGRILSAVCAFDHASRGGLAAGLEAVRSGAGTAFDPVVTAELIYLFREPWQLQAAA